MRIQTNFGYPGLISECETLLTSLGLEDKNPINFTKKAWNNMIKTTTKQFNERSLLEDMKRYKKINYFEMSKEDFGVKDYLNEMKLSEARLFFRMRLKIVQGIKFCYKSETKYKDSLWSCPICSLTGNYDLDSLSHTFVCPGLAVLRRNRDLSVDGDIVEYMKEVLRLREYISSNVDV